MFLLPLYSTQLPKRGLSKKEKKKKKPTKKEKKKKKKKKNGPIGVILVFITVKRNGELKVMFNY